ncbi:MAG: hypothetical protein IJZ76_11700 [Lachnospiraceae bacterium]|nr:hypothetical protein [Lachnospiraceae bacterium]
MFEIINEEKKQIIISLHLEQIYIEMNSINHLKDEKKLFKTDTLTKSCVDYLVKRFSDNKQYGGYEYIIDFQHIKYVQRNMNGVFLGWISGLDKRKIIHFENFDNYIELRHKSIPEESQTDYQNAFAEYGKKYIVANCCDGKGYTTQIGTRLGVYVDLKKIINDSVEMLRWCYIIACGLDEYFSTENELIEKKSLFFCHTMNGTYISGILSQLIGCNIVYVDHLGPYNKLNKIDFYKEKSHSKEFIIVADMMCQGNEFLRAKNIVEYMGGTVSGCVGILKMNISNLLKDYPVNIFALEYTAEDAAKELSYTICTDLCSVKCSSCKRKEG